MFILSQDKDTIFTLSDKGLFKSAIYTEDVYVNGKYYGSNIYGKGLFKEYLLGTYDCDEVEQIMSEIFTLLKAGAEFYSMPAPTLEPEDLGVSI